MKCRNCDAEVFEGNKYCNECGHDLVDDNKKEAKDEGFPPFIKNAIASPWKSIGPHID
ncbi:hypothetical protein [Salinicoccus sp. Marseille-QA3877]